jgi:hypothetical protein
VTCIAKTPGLTGYKSDGCRCATCREGSVKYEARRRRLIAYGRWQQFIDAEPARQHIATLRASGLGTARIARLAGLAQATINGLVWGDHGRTQTRIRPATAAAILAVPADETNLADTALVDGTGTRRRLQALHRAGWRIGDLADHLGCTSANVSLIIRSTSPVKVATRRTITGLYDRLCALTPEPGPGSVRARNHATRAGWPPPHAWDDDTIDNPAALPNYGNPNADVIDDVLVEQVLDGQRDTRLSRANVRHAIRAGYRSGMTATAIGHRIRRNPTYVKQLAVNLGVPELTG